MSEITDARLRELDNSACDQLARNPDGLWQDMTADEAHSILTELQERRDRCAKLVEANSVVSRKDAISFLECACRNWSHVPSLSEEDIGDVAMELLRFLKSRALGGSNGE